jgi:putative transposase
VDGLYVKAGLEKDKAAVLVAIGGLSDGRKVVLAVMPGQLSPCLRWALAAAMSWGVMAWTR